MIELDLSCPNVFGTGSGLDEGKKPETVAMITGEVARQVSISRILKTHK